MARVIVIGAGVVGLETAMLLAKDGHDAIVLERDPAPPLASAEQAWGEWQRRGVNQFRLPHILLARTRQVLDAELPEVARAVEGVGGLRYNPILDIPESIRGPERPDDHDFELLTARRPVFELAFADAAAATDGVTIRRGSTVEALLLSDGGSGPIPRVTGVRTDDGEELLGDLVVDVSGRRSAVPRLLAEAGARPPEEELDDSGFMYFGRHYASGDGSVPVALGPVLIEVGTIASVTTPADNGAWGLVLVTNASDRALLGLRDPVRWETVFRSLPLVAHWVDGTPLDEGIVTMSKIEDRIRTYVIDGAPVATGIVAVGDAWACSNPSQGRGVSMGSLHAVTLRDTLRSTGFDDPADLAVAFHEATEQTVRPWFEWTRFGDRHRLAEVEALIEGTAYEPDDAAWELEQAMRAASGKDPELLRILVRAAFLLSPLAEALSVPAVRDRALALGGSWRDEAVLGPGRDELVALVNQ